MIVFLKVKNYKSLEDVEMKLGPLHVFVGANGSGKSNLFDVFQFLKDLAEIGAPAVHSRGGFSQIVWGGDVKRAISFELHALIENGPHQKQKVNYYIEIAGSLRHYYITQERLSVNNGREKEKPLLVFPIGDNKVSLTDVHGHKWELGRVPDRLFVQQVRDDDRYGPLSEFARELYGWSFYNFEPSAMRKPNAVKQDFHLQRTGENFSSVLHSIQSEHGGKFGEIESLLKTALPELRHLFTALTKEGQTYASLEENSFALKIPSWTMSDGTLRLLAQLAVLFSPEPPALACFEEPENFLHPAWLTLVADVLKSAAGKIKS